MAEVGKDVAKDAVVYSDSAPVGVRGEFLRNNTDVKRVANMPVPFIF
jgi:hypothetical protein